MHSSLFENGDLGRAEKSMPHGKSITFMNRRGDGRHALHLQFIGQRTSVGHAHA